MITRFEYGFLRTCASAAILASILLGTAAFAAPSVPNEVKLPGTQPGDMVDPFDSPSTCQSCHGGTVNPDFEPSFGWMGSMMGNASRDPLFWATLAVAEQDFIPDPDPNARGGVGDLCMRCHTPNGWLAGRSTPTDGSGLTAGTDANGVECEMCHLMVDPDQTVNITGTIEEQNAPFEAFDPLSGDGYNGAAEYVINSEGSRLGPYASPPFVPHAFKTSSFHRQSEMCATCHDVSNPAVGDLAPNNGAPIGLAPGDFDGTVGGTLTDKAALNNEPHKFGVVERTYSEWVASALDTKLVNDFNTLPAELKVAGGALDVAYHQAYDARSDANYEDGELRYYTCQTCHMAASTGVGAKQPAVPTRTDLPRHDLTGSGYWTPSLILYQEDEGTLRFGGGLTTLQRDALAAGALRAEAMLQSAGSLSGVQNGTQLDVTVTNLTGHKLISGYPEGRRMWLNVKWYDGSMTLIHEDGAYGPIGRTVNDAGGMPHQVESILDLDNTVTYEAKLGLDEDWADTLLSIPAYSASMVLSYDRMTDATDKTLGDLSAAADGTMYKSFHFVLNNVVIDDNRIPPYGFDHDIAEERNALPVPATRYGNPGAGGTYDHWDDVSFAIPVGAETAEVRLYYQQTSWEYIQFLWLQNDGLNSFLGDEGDNLLDAWLHTGQNAPLEMTMTGVNLTAIAAPPGEASLPANPADQMKAAYNHTTGEVELVFVPACSATDHDIHHGDLALVSTYSYTGAECAVGTSGTAAFDPGPGNAFFVVVGNNGTVEGSYGFDSSAADRPEDVGTAGCDLPQDLTATCIP